MSEIDEKKDALIATAKRCFDLRLQTNAGGNLSVRLESQDAILIKPSGVGFNECSRDNLQIVHMDGRIEPSPHKPSKDLGFHLGLYRAREDIRAVVHCHSPWATGYASAGLEIPCLTVQSIEKMGRVPLIPLSSRGGPQTEHEISPVFSDSRIVAAVLANHGTIGVGPSLMSAQYLAEIIEETAHVAYLRDVLASVHGKHGNGLPRFGRAEDADAGDARSRSL